MTKRTFVLFFCLVQILAFPLLAKQHAALCKIDFGTAGFSPYTIGTVDETEEVVILDDTIETHQTIIREDVAEWRENLSKMLRHRHSSFRFASLESAVFYTFYCFYNPKAVRDTSLTAIFAYTSHILPGYYSFLHRLCPF